MELAYLKFIFAYWQIGSVPWRRLGKLDGGSLALGFGSISCAKSYQAINRIPL